MGKAVNAALLGYFEPKQVEQIFTTVYKMVMEKGFAVATTDALLDQ